MGYQYESCDIKPSLFVFDPVKSQIVSCCTAFLPEIQDCRSEAFERMCTLLHCCQLLLVYSSYYATPLESSYSTSSSALFVAPTTMVGNDFQMALHECSLNHMKPPGQNG